MLEAVCGYLYGLEREASISRNGLKVTVPQKGYTKRGSKKWLLLSDLKVA
jgi:hypothetical protein